LKIIYFFEWRLDQSSGVIKKIISQVEAWKKLGHRVHLLCITVPPIAKEFNKKDIDIYSINLPRKLSNHPFGFYLSKLLLIHKVRRTCEEIDPDIIYYRKAIWYPGLARLFKNFIVVYEINTKIDDEIELLPFYKKIIFKMSADYSMNAATAFISVTNEISLSLKKYNKKQIVVANGYDVRNLPDLLHRKSNKPVCIMVVSPGFKWHGCEKIPYLAKCLPEYEFRIVGIKDTSEISNLYYLGYLNNTDLIKQYSESDIGIGTLSLYEKSMEEACPLKVCEYIAYGLPVIIGYNDINLGKQDFVLNIENYPNNIKDNVDNIDTFINNWHGKRIPNKSKILIDLHEKEQSRIKYFEKLIS